MCAAIVSPAPKRSVPNVQGDGSVNSQLMSAAGLTHLGDMCSQHIRSQRNVVVTQTPKGFEYRPAATNDVHELTIVLDKRATDHRHPKTVGELSYSLHRLEAAWRVLDVSTGGTIVSETLPLTDATESIQASEEKHTEACRSVLLAQLKSPCKVFVVCGSEARQQWQNVSVLVEGASLTFDPTESRWELEYEGRMRFVYFAPHPSNTWSTVKFKQLLGALGCAYTSIGHQVADIGSEESWRKRANDVVHISSIRRTEGVQQYAFMNVKAVDAKGDEQDHRYLLANGVLTHNCKLAQELTTYPKEARRVALTGTPLQNELHELWSLLNFIHPSIFSSSESFEKWFSTPFDKMPVGSQDKENHQSMNEEEKLLVINRLHAILRPFMLRREKSQVETDLADKIEKVLRCSLTPMQEAMYSAILEGKVTMHNRVMQLRKICNHPILFHPYLRGQPGANPYTPDETMIKMCGKFTLLDQILHKLKRTGHKVLIFNQMTKVMDILEEYCYLRKFSFLRLDGSTSADVRTESVAKFNAPDSPYFIFMLSTKAGGLGLNLQAADTVILFDSDWNPSNDAQAMARSHRIGQKNQCIVLRFITTATVEEKVLSTATTKLSHEQMVIQAGMFHTRYSHNASRAIAAEAMAKTQDDTGDDQNELWTDDFISRTLARSDAELQIFQEMDKLAKQSESSGVSREMPENKMPKWCWDWCVNGHNASSVEQGLVPFNEKILDVARTKNSKALVEDPLNPKARVRGAAIVEVNTSDDDDYDVVAEASGVNDSILDEEEERPLNYDEIDDEDGLPPPAPMPSTEPPSAAVQPATPLPPTKKSRKSTTGGAAKGKRKRDDENDGTASAASVATPAPKKKKNPDGTASKRSSKKATVSTPVAASPFSYDDGMDDVDDYQPLSYSDAEDDDIPSSSLTSNGPVISATSSTGFKLVIRGGGTPTSSIEASSTQSKSKKKKSTSGDASGPIRISIANMNR